MSSSLLRAAVAAALATSAASAAFAHIGYGGRDFGSFTGLASQSVTIANQAVTGNYGWADATDFNFGDSHRARAFRFHLDDTALVSFSVAAKADATATSIGGLLPGFSIYQGLAHLSPASADHDGAPITVAYLASLPGEAKEGAWVATGDWQIGNDGNASFAPAMTRFTFVGYAVDGTAANFSNANPALVGDGLADGKVSASFVLGPGDYSIFVGGADYWAQNPGNPDLAKAYGLSATLSVSAVPEPQSALLLAAGLSAVAGLRRRRGPRG